MQPNNFTPANGEHPATKINVNQQSDAFGPYPNYTMGKERNTMYGKLEKSLAECKALSDNLRTLSSKKEEAFSRFNTLMHNDYGTSTINNNNHTMKGSQYSTQGSHIPPSTIPYNPVNSNVYGTMVSSNYNQHQQQQQNHIDSSYQNLSASGAQNPGYHRASGYSYYKGGPSDSRQQASGYHNNIPSDIMMEGKYGVGERLDRSGKMNQSDYQKSTMLSASRTRNMENTMEGSRRSKSRNSRKATSTKKGGARSTSWAGKSSEKRDSSKVRFGVADENRDRERLLQKFGLGNLMTEMDTMQKQKPKKKKVVKKMGGSRLN